MKRDKNKDRKEKGRKGLILRIMQWHYIHFLIIYTNWKSNNVISSSLFVSECYIKIELER